MKRRTFIAGLGSAAAWPLAARAQQGDRVRRIGVLMGYENDTVANSLVSEFIQEVAKLGWTDGQNLRMDIRWAAGGVDRARMYAKELVGLRPEVILAHASVQTAALQQETRTIPIVFVDASDPVGSGFVTDLARPGGNITGFGNHEPSMGGKWLELLTEIAPGVKRVAAMFNPDTARYVASYFLPSFEVAARALKVEPITARVHNETEIEMAVTSLGREPGGGLVIMPDSFMLVHRAPIAFLAARSNVPAIYWTSIIARDGGLLSYGASIADLFRRAAPYVDRILRGAKAADLPAQMPVKFEMALNVKAAKSLGLTVPQSMLLRADEVIE
jgi:putative tryptophan/tyrosine transport system substrate-binding protein